MVIWNVVMILVGIAALLAAVVTVTWWLWQVWMWAFPRRAKGEVRGFEVVLRGGEDGKNS